MTTRHQILRTLGAWQWAAFILAIATLVPVFMIATELFNVPSDNWRHIQQYLLQDYLYTTGVLFVLTAGLATLFGVSLAYLVTVFDFPFRNFFRWALILPLSIPAYIAACTYSGMLDYTGAVTQALTWAAGRPILLDIMSLPGAVFIFTVCLYPYIYIISRAFFAKYTAPLIESARLLGKNHWQIFFSVILPLSRGAIASGCTLVLMELANDYGVASYFGLQTFSIAVFRVWFGMSDVNSAVRLCLYLLALILAAVGLEKALRGQRRYALTAAKTSRLSPTRLSGLKAAGATLYCLAIWSLGFFIPFVQLLFWAARTYGDVLNAGFVEATANTLLAALLCASVIVALAVLLTNSARISHTWFTQASLKLSSVGYALPGPVIAIGILLLFVRLSGWTEALLSLSLTTSAAMLYFAYLVRFLAVGTSAVEQGFAKIGKTFFEASRTMGLGVTQTFFKVDLPMIRPALLGAFSLVFVDMAKELPLTLILRPFNYNALATKVYEYAHDERVRQSAPAALLIIFICALSVYTLARTEKE